MENNDDEIPGWPQPPMFGLNDRRDATINYDDADLFDIYYDIIYNHPTNYIDNVFFFRRFPSPEDFADYLYNNNIILPRIITADNKQKIKDFYISRGKMITRGGGGKRRSIRRSNKSKKTRKSKKIRKNKKMRKSRK